MPAYGAQMIGDNPDEWGGATFERESGLERRRILLVSERAPVVVRLPIDDDWFEEFRIDGYRDGEPIYRSVGFIPRG